MWHVWVKAYRVRNELTQEQAATMLGVDPRTVRHWEAGAVEPSAAVRQRLSQILVPSPAHALGAQLRTLLEMSSDFIMLFDENLHVVAQSASHARHMYRQYGMASMVGQDWRRYMPAAFDAYVTDMGGPRGMVSNGFVSIRASFVRQPGEKGGAAASAGVSDHTLLRLADGVAHISITKSLHPEDVSAEPATITFLET
jgi:transcriptional regulator with XRE-family HTH domain